MKDYFELIIPYNPCNEDGMNYILGSHWSKKNAAKIQVYYDVAWRAKTFPTFEQRVEIHIWWHEGGMDLDNHAVLRKYIIDGLKCGVIKDDNPRHVGRIIEDFWRGTGIKVRVKAM